MRALREHPCNSSHCLDSEQCKERVKEVGRENGWEMGKEKERNGGRGGEIVSESINQALCCCERSENTHVTAQTALDSE